MTAPLGKVFLTGDFNSRTSVESDCLDFDRYLDDEDIFLNDILLQPRVNSDHVIDAHGRRLLLLCQTSDLLIANGRLHDDCSIGEQTFSSLRFRCILGQFLANLDMFFTPYHSKIETCFRLASSLLIRYK